MKALSIRDIRSEARDAGRDLATWVDLPEIGERLPLHVDWVGIGEIETPADQLEAWEALVGAAEENARCYSPFEFTAAAINARDAAYGEGAAEAGWNAWDDYFWRGVRETMRARFSDLMREATS